MTTAAFFERIGDGFFPATDIDRQLLQSYKEKQPTIFDIRKSSDRDMERHRLYFGGLVKLVANHWNPGAHIALMYDRRLLNDMIDFVAHQDYPTDGLSVVIDAFISFRVSKARSLYHEQSAKDLIQTIHDWLKEESGYFDYVVTPTGVKRQIRSISFSAMKTQEEFEEFYSKAFNVAWNHVLINVGYKSEREAQDMALRMMRMR